MADEISETKTRYERLDPNVVKVFRLAELANKDNEDCHLGEQEPSPSHWAWLSQPLECAGLDLSRNYFY